MNLQAHGTSASPTAAVIGTTPPMLASLPSTATTPARIATATSGSAPLSLTMPEGVAPCEQRPAQNAKGLLGLGGSPPEYETTCSRPETAGAGSALFQRIYNFENLYRAWLRAREGKRGQSKTAEFNFAMEAELITLQNQLMWRCWQPGEYEAFEVFEPKRRMIYAPAFKDRVLHHALVEAITPLFEQVFIYNSFACRVGKGAHAGATAAEKAIRKTYRKHGKVFALKGDISKYFQSIDRSILKGLLRRRITCLDTLLLCDHIIDSAPETNGLPLGNLTSQLFANVYLHELDHHIVNILGVKQYFRYMDDWVVIGHDKAALQETLKAARSFANSILLTINPKTAIFPVNPDRGRSVDFLGYQLYGTHRRLRQRSLRKGFARAKDFSRDPNPHNLNRLTSWYAHARHAEPTGMMRRIFQILIHPGNDYAN